VTAHRYNAVEGPKTRCLDSTNEIRQKHAVKKNQPAKRMANWSFYSRRIRILRIISVILIVVSLVAMAWGLRSVLANHGLQDASLPALWALLAGWIPLGLGAIILFVVRSQDVAYDRITRSDRPVWVRWQCTSKEAQKFIATEGSKSGNPMPSYRSMVITFIGIALAVAFIQRANFTWDGFLIGTALLGGIAVGFLWYLRAVSAAKMETTIVRASTEVIMDEEGVLTGETVLKWRALNWGLQEATYEAGKPDVLNLVFLAGTLPGSGVIRNAQSTETVRIPVTASKADEVRKLLGTRISEQLLERG